MLSIEAIEQFGVRLDQPGFATSTPSSGDVVPYVAVSALVGGGFMTSWLADTNGDAILDAIAVQRFGSDGIKVGTPVTLQGIPANVIDQYRNGAEFRAVLAPLADGGYALTYQSVANAFIRQGAITRILDNGYSLSVPIAGQPERIVVSNVPDGGQVNISGIAANGVDALILPVILDEAGSVKLSAAQLAMFYPGSLLHVTISGLAPGTIAPIYVTAEPVYETIHYPINGKILSESFATTASAIGTLGVARLSWDAGLPIKFDFEGLEPAPSSTLRYYLDVTLNNYQAPSLADFNDPSVISVMPSYETMTLRLEMRADAAGIINVPSLIRQLIAGDGGSIAIGITGMPIGATVNGTVDLVAPEVLVQGLFSQNFSSDGLPIGDAVRIDTPDAVLLRPVSSETSSLFGSEVMHDGGLVVHWLADSDGDGVPDSLMLQRMGATGVIGAPIAAKGLPAVLPRAVDVTPLADGTIAISYQQQAEVQNGFQILSAGGVTSVLPEGRPLWFQVQNSPSDMLTFELSGAGNQGEAKSISVIPDANGYIYVSQALLDQFGVDTRISLVIGGLQSRQNVSIAYEYESLWAYPEGGETRTITVTNTVSNGSTSPAGFVALFDNAVGRTLGYNIVSYTENSPGSGGFLFSIFSPSNTLIERLGQANMLTSQGGQTVVVDGYIYNFNGATGGLSISAAAGYDPLVFGTGYNIRPDASGNIELPARFLEVVGDLDYRVFLLGRGYQIGTPVVATATVEVATEIEPGLFSFVFEPETGKVSSPVEAGSSGAPVVPPYQGYGLASYVDTDALPNGGFLKSWVTDANADGQADAIAVQAYHANGQSFGNVVLLKGIPEFVLAPYGTDSGEVVAPVLPIDGGGYVLAYQGDMARSQGVAQFRVPLPPSMGETFIQAIALAGRPKEFQILDPIPADMTFSLRGLDIHGNLKILPVTFDDSQKLVISQEILDQFPYDARIALHATGGLVYGQSLRVSWESDQIWRYFDHNPLTYHQIIGGQVPVTINGVTTATGVIVFAGNGRVESWHVDQYTVAAGAQPRFTMNLANASAEILQALGIPSEFQRLGQHYSVDRGEYTYSLQTNGYVLITGPRGSSLTIDAQGNIRVPQDILDAVGTGDYYLTLACNGLALGAPFIATAQVREPAEIEGGVYLLAFDETGERYIVGTDGPDAYGIQGTSGNDNIVALDGDDFVNAGDGDDLIVGGSGRGDDIYNGGAGVDTIRYTSATAGITVNLASGIATSTAGGDAAGIGNDMLVGIENVIAGTYDDVIIGDAKVNALTGGGGNDAITGGNRADIAIYSGNRSDYTITTVAGVTTVRDNRAGSPDGTDTLRGMNILRFADIQLFQTTAANKVTLAGQAQTYAVANSEVVQGTNAAEHFIVAPKTSALVFAGNNDVVDLSGAIDSYTFSKTGTQLQISDGSYTTTLSVGGSFTLRTASGSTSVAIDFTQGGAIKLGGTQVVGSATFDPAAAILDASNVPITATQGSLQTVTGTSGNDTLTGVAGKVSEITGGSGNDTITGGSRADVAVYSGNRSDYTITTVAGVTTVVDNRAGSPDGTDTLRGMNILRFADLQLFQTAAANKLTLAGQAQTYAVANSEVVQGTNAAEHFIVAPKTSAMVFAGNNDVVDLSRAIDSYTFSKTGTQLQISDGIYTTTLSVGGSFTLRTASGSASVAIDFTQGGAIKLGGTQIVGSATFDPIAAILDPDNYSDNAEFRQITVNSDASYNGHEGIVDVFVIDASQSLTATIAGFEDGDILEFRNHSEELGVSFQNTVFNDDTATLLAGSATITLTSLANDNFSNEASFEDIYGAGAIGYVM